MVHAILKSVCLLVAASVLGASAASAQARETPACLKPSSRELRLYQSLMYSGVPDMARLGFAKAHVIDRDIWVDESTRQAIAPDKLAATVSRAAAAGGLVVLDIESIPLTGKDAEVTRSLALLSQAGTLARRASGPALVGVYGLLPLSEYWRPLDLHPDGGGFAQWQRDTGRLARLDAAIDVNLPSLYTHYNDREGWVRQAEAMVCQARKLSDKPVIAFIWPEFHGGGDHPVGTYLPRSYWRLQLETLARIADGVVIWGGYDFKRPGAQPWNPRAGWWLETQNFLARHRTDASLRPVAAGN